MTEWWGSVYWGGGDGVNTRGGVEVHLEGTCLYDHSICFGTLNRLFRCLLLSPPFFSSKSLSCPHCHPPPQSLFPPLCLQSDKGFTLN